MSHIWFSAKTECIPSAGASIQSILIEHHSVVACHRSFSGVCPNISIEETSYIFSFPSIATHSFRATIDVASNGYEQVGNSLVWPSDSSFDLQMASLLSFLSTTSLDKRKWACLFSFALILPWAMLRDASPFVFVSRSYSFIVGILSVVITRVIRSEKLRIL